MQSVQIHNGFFLVFDKGEEVIETLRAFCEQEEMHWATFNGIGAVEDVQIGYYDLPTKQYVFHEEPGPFEVANFDGNVSELNEEPLVHAHAVLARCDDTLSCIGGHVKLMRVHITLKVSLWEVTQPLTRTLDPESGLNLLEI